MTTDRQDRHPALAFNKPQQFSYQDSIKGPLTSTSPSKPHKTMTAGFKKTPSLAGLGMLFALAILAVTGQRCTKKAISLNLWHGIPSRAVSVSVGPARQFGRNRAATRFRDGTDTHATAGIHGSEAESWCSVPAHAAATIEMRQLAGHNPA